MTRIRRSLESRWKGDRVLLCHKEEVERHLDLLIDQQGSDEGSPATRLESG